jgi:hypothetical protein
MSGPRNSILVCTIRTRLHTAQLHTARSAGLVLDCRFQSSTRPAELGHRASKVPQPCSVI